MALFLLPYELNTTSKYEIQFEDANFNAGMNFADVCIECQNFELLEQLLSRVEDEQTLN